MEPTDAEAAALRAPFEAGDPHRGLEFIAADAALVRPSLRLRLQLLHQDLQSAAAACSVERVRSAVLRARSLAHDVLGVAGPIVEQRLALSYAHVREGTEALAAAPTDMLAPTAADENPARAEKLRDFDGLAFSEAFKHGDHSVEEARALAFVFGYMPAALPFAADAAHNARADAAYVEMAGIVNAALAAGCPDSDSRWAVVTLQRVLLTFVEAVAAAKWNEAFDPSALERPTAGNPAPLVRPGPLLPTAQDEDAPHPMRQDHPTTPEALPEVAARIARRASSCKLPGNALDGFTTAVATAYSVVRALEIMLRHTAGDAATADFPPARRAECMRRASACKTLVHFLWCAAHRKPPSPYSCRLLANVGGDFGEAFCTIAATVVCHVTASTNSAPGIDAAAVVDAEFARMQAALRLACPDASPAGVTMAAAAALCEGVALHRRVWPEGLAARDVHRVCYARSKPNTDLYGTDALHLVAIALAGAEYRTAVDVAEERCGFLAYPLEQQMLDATTATWAAAWHRRAGLEPGGDGSHRRAGEVVALAALRDIEASSDVASAQQWCELAQAAACAKAAVPGHPQALAPLRALAACSAAPDWHAAVGEPTNVAAPVLLDFVTTLLRTTVGANRTRALDRPLADRTPNAALSDRSCPALDDLVTWCARVRPKSSRDDPDHARYTSDLCRVFAELTSPFAIAYGTWYHTCVLRGPAALEAGPALDIDVAAAGNDAGLPPPSSDAKPQPKHLLRATAGWSGNSDRNTFNDNAFLRREAAGAASPSARARPLQTPAAEWRREHAQPFHLHQLRHALARRCVADAAAAADASGGAGVAVAKSVMFEAPHCDELLLALARGEANLLPTSALLAQRAAARRNILAAYASHRAANSRNDAPAFSFEQRKKGTASKAGPASLAACELILASLADTCEVIAAICDPATSCADAVAAARMFHRDILDPNDLGVLEAATGRIRARAALAFCVVAPTLVTTVSQFGPSHTPVPTMTAVAVLQASEGPPALAPHLPRLHAAMQHVADRVMAPLLRAVLTDAWAWGICARTDEVTQCVRNAPAADVVLLRAPCMLRDLARSHAVLELAAHMWNVRSHHFSAWAGRSDADNTPWCRFPTAARGVEAVKRLVAQGAGVRPRDGYALPCWVEPDDQASRQTYLVAVAAYLTADGAPGSVLAVHVVPMTLAATPEAFADRIGAIVASDEFSSDELYVMSLLSAVAGAGCISNDAIPHLTGLVARSAYNHAVARTAAAPLADGVARRVNRAVALWCPDELPRLAEDAAATAGDASDAAAAASDEEEARRCQALVSPCAPSRLVMGGRPGGFTPPAAGPFGELIAFIIRTTRDAHDARDPATADAAARNMLRLRACIATDTNLVKALVAACAPTATTFNFPTDADRAALMRFCVVRLMYGPLLHEEQLHKEFANAFVTAHVPREIAAAMMLTMVELKLTCPVIYTVRPKQHNGDLHAALDHATVFDVCFDAAAQPSQQEYLNSAPSPRDTVSFRQRSLGDASANEDDGDGPRSARTRLPFQFLNDDGHPNVLCILSRWELDDGWSRFEPRVTRAFLQHPELRPSSATTTHRGDRVPTDDLAALALATMHHNCVRAPINTERLAAMLQSLQPRWAAPFLWWLLFRIARSVQVRNGVRDVALRVFACFSELAALPTFLLHARVVLADLLRASVHVTVAEFVADIHHCLSTQPRDHYKFAEAPLIADVSAMCFAALLYDGGLIQDGSPLRPQVVRCVRWWARLATLLGHEAAVTALAVTVGATEVVTKPRLFGGGIAPTNSGPAWYARSSPRGNIANELRSWAARIADGLATLRWHNSAMSSSLRTTPLTNDFPGGLATRLPSGGAVAANNPAIAAVVRDAMPTTPTDAASIGRTGEAAAGGALAASVLHTGIVAALAVRYSAMRLRKSKPEDGELAFMRAAPPGGAGPRVDSVELQVVLLAACAVGRSHSVNLAQSVSQAPRAANAALPHHPTQAVSRCLTVISQPLGSHRAYHSQSGFWQRQFRQFEEHLVLRGNQAVLLHRMRRCRAPDGAQLPWDACRRVAAFVYGAFDVDSHDVRYFCT